MDAAAASLYWCSPSLCVGWEGNGGEGGEVKARPVFFVLFVITIFSLFTDDGHDDHKCTSHQVHRYTRDGKRTCGATCERGEGGLLHLSVSPI